MQDELPDLPPLPAKDLAKAGPVAGKPGFFTDDKRLVKIIIFLSFGVLLLLGITASVLEKIAPRGNQKSQPEESFSSGLWQIQARPGQILLGFYEDKNQNGRFDYQEAVFDKVSVAIRRAGETEPFRRVAADTDGLVKIDDLNPGDYEISLDNYSRPAAADWQFFEDYQSNGEFLPTAWRPVSLNDQGYKELIGVTAYQPPLLLVLTTDSGLVWYDPERDRIYGQTGFQADFAARGQDIFYLEAGKLKQFSWQQRSVTEELNWLEEAEAGGWWLSPQGKTVAYLAGKQLNYRSQIESCAEGSLVWEGIRPAVKAVSFIDETHWLAIARTEADQPWQLVKVSCGQAEVLPVIAPPVDVDTLVDGDWFYSTGEAAYFVAGGKTVKYASLGGGEGTNVSADGRYLLKQVAPDQWLIVDYPAVKAEGVEKQYRVTGISGRPSVIGDDVYFVGGQAVVKVKLEGSGVWEIANNWELKNMKAVKVLGVDKPSSF